MGDIGSIRIFGRFNIGSQSRKALCRVSLLGLGAAFELVSRYVPEMGEIIAGWEEGRRIGIGILPTGPSITLEKRGKRIRYMGSGLADPKVSLLFKNFSAGVLLFTGQIGAAQAVAENRVCVHGNNHEAMEVTHALAVVQTYLFPGIIIRNTFKRPPVLNIRQKARKALVLSLVTPVIAGAAFRKA